MIHQVFNANAIKSFMQSQEEQAGLLCKNILDGDSTFFDAVKL